MYVWPFLILSTFAGNEHEWGKTHQPPQAQLISPVPTHKTAQSAAEQLEAQGRKYLEMRDHRRAIACFVQAIKVWRSISGKESTQGLARCYRCLAPFTNFKAGIQVPGERL